MAAIVNYLDNSFGSLFSGIGGLDLGLERAGWDCRWQIEWDPFCLAVLAEQFPDATRYSDIARLNMSRLEPVRLICGGFPCQPHSVAGARKGEEDGRWLWPYFASTIEQVSPQIVFIENVLGLRTSGMRSVLADLASLGFDAEWSSLGAIDVGAPHKRDRLWIIGYSEANGRQWGDLADADSDGELISKPGALPTAPGEIRGPEEYGARVRPDTGNGRAIMADAISQRPGRGRPDTEFSQAGGQQLATVFVGRGEPGGRESNVADANGPRLEERRGPGAIRAEHNPAEYRGKSPFDVGPRDTADLREWWEIEPGLGRVANGIPDRVDRLKALGNAVVPQVAEWVARNRISQILNEPPTIDKPVLIQHRRRRRNA